MTEWIIETTHGIYPTGKWGYCRPALSKDSAIEMLTHPIHSYDRARNVDTGEIIKPKQEDEHGSKSTTE